jgi:hypothetical protein
MSSRGREGAMARKPPIRWRKVDWRIFFACVFWCGLAGALASFVVIGLVPWWHLSDPEDQTVGLVLLGALTVAGAWFGALLALEDSRDYPPPKSSEASQFHRSIPMPDFSEQQYGTQGWREQQAHNKWVEDESIKRSRDQRGGVDDEGWPL